MSFDAAGPGGHVFSLRDTTPDDDELHAHFYAASQPHWETLPPAARDQLAQHQSLIQISQYRSRYPDLRIEMAEVCASPVARLMTGHEHGVMCLVDLVVLPQHRGQGIGRSLVVIAQRRAADDLLPLRSTVRRDNEASLGLVRQLSFEQVDQDELYNYFLWTPPPALPETC